jgi:hypothetical protein
MSNTEKPIVNRKKLRVIKMLTAVLLILLSLGTIGTGLALLNASQKNQPQITTDAGTPVALIGSLAITEKQYIVPVSNPSLPVIQTFTDTLQVDDRLSGQGIEFTTQLLSELGKKQVAVQRVTIYTRDYSVLHLANTNVIYKEKASASELASSLQSMLSVFTIEGKMPLEIDFRFDKPVLRY